MKKILMISNTAWSLYNFRYGLIKTLINNGYKVEILAPFDDTVEKLEAMGCACYDIKLDRKSKNPFKDIKLFLEYKKKIKKINPDIMLSYTIKPNIYGSIAARKLNIPIINNITGLGNIFNKETVITKIVKLLYKYAFKKVNKVFFQNYDDMNLFLKNNLVNIIKEVYQLKEKSVEISEDAIKRFNLKKIISKYEKILKK